jgi:hypothetical protein
MPLQLSNPPTGPTPLPQHPPTLADIANAIPYNKNILVSRGMLATLSLVSHSHPFPEAGVATADDVGEAVVYQSAVIMANASGGIFFTCNPIDGIA